MMDIVARAMASKALTQTTGEVAEIAKEVINDVLDDIFKQEVIDGGTYISNTDDINENINEV